MTTPTDRRIATLMNRYISPSHGFARLGLKRDGVWMPSWEELDSAIQAVESELEPR